MLTCLIFLILVVARLQQSAVEGKICKRLPDLMSNLHACTKKYRPVLVTPSTSDRAVDYGSAFCSKFWPGVYKCMKQSINTDGCTNVAQILNVLDKYAYMCQGMELKPNIKADLERISSTTLLNCRGILGLHNCGNLLLNPSNSSIKWDTLSFEQDIEAIQEFAVKPTIQCIYNTFVDFIASNPRKQSCLAYKRELWIYFTLGFNYMGMFGVYSEPSNFPNAVKS